MNFYSRSISILCIFRTNAHAIYIYAYMYISLEVHFILPLSIYPWMDPSTYPRLEGTTGQLALVKQKLAHASLGQGWSGSSLWSDCWTRLVWSSMTSTSNETSRCCNMPPCVLRWWIFNDLYWQRFEQWWIIHCWSGYMNVFFFTCFFCIKNGQHFGRSPQRGPSRESSGKRRSGCCATAFLPGLFRWDARVEVENLERYLRGIYIYISTSTNYTHIYIYMYIMCLSLCVCRLHIQIHIYSCIYIYIYIHTICMCACVCVCAYQCIDQEHMLLYLSTQLLFWTMY